MCQGSPSAQKVAIVKEVRRKWTRTLKIGIETNFGVGNSMVYSKEENLQKAGILCDVTESKVNNFQRKCNDGIKVLNFSKYDATSGCNA